MKQEEFQKQLREIADRVAVERDADVMLYSGDISAPHDDEIFEWCSARRRRPNMFMMLSTWGGDAAAAYRIARCLGRHYKTFTVAVGGFCKSAGTLLLIGANELVMAQQAELGPLDVQLRKADEYGERSSGLTPVQALTLLQQRAYDFFSQKLVHMKVELGMTTRTAAEIAGKLATDLYSAIFAQIDPMRLGEMDRAVNIAIKYGERLAVRGKNLKTEDSLARLVVDYPSHGFVIDRDEAKEIFQRVSDPTPAEDELLKVIKPLVRAPLDASAGHVILYLSSEVPNEQQQGKNAADGRSRRASAPAKDKGDGAAHQSHDSGNPARRGDSDVGEAGDGDHNSAVPPEGAARQQSVNPNRTNGQAEPAARKSRKRRPPARAR